ncbi:MAG: hypothetical protein H7317_00770 [Pseudorhodobacter sp.]|nr:hypothetical protein [Pseudorhodobacter sp.]
MRYLLALCLALAACDSLPASFKRPPPPPPPLTLPPADGRQAVLYNDGFDYVVNYQSLAQAREKVFLRVARNSAPDLTYSDGLLAKRVAEAYCARYNRPLNPAAYGTFSQPNAWLFEGGCG